MLRGWVGGLTHGSVQTPQKWKLLLLRKEITTIVQRLPSSSPICTDKTHIWNPRFIDVIFHPQICWEERGEKGELSLSFPASLLHSCSCVWPFSAGRAEPRGELLCASVVLSGRNVKVLIAIEREEKTRWPAAQRVCADHLGGGSQPRPHTSTRRAQIYKSQQTSSKPVSATLADDVRASLAWL